MRPWLSVMSIALLVPVIALVAPRIALAELDEAGNVIGDWPPPPSDSPGDPCGTCSSIPNDRGVDFKNGELWVIDASAVLYHFVNCSIVQTIQTNAPSNAFGLGYDSVRDLWIVTNPLTDQVFQVNMAGQVVQTWPAPGTGAVGAAYDPTRDLYWISDFIAGAITSIRPTTGLPGPSIPVPSGTRIAGTGYDLGSDIIVYHGRDQVRTYCISAATGQLINSFPIPPGNNNGQGAGVAPDGNVWLSHFEDPTLYCFAGCGAATPVETSTWGSIKAIYR